MDIYSAKIHLDKVHKFLEQRADKDIKLYSNSEKRLRDLAAVCKEIMQLISEIIQDDVISNDEPEQPKYIEDLLNSLSQDLQNLKPFIDYNCKSGAGNILQEVQFSEHIKEPIPGSIDATSTSKSTDTNTDLSGDDRKYIFRTYRKVLQSLSPDFMSIEVQQCIEMLQKWFDIRFIKYGHAKNFKYNIRKFPDWVMHFVLVFGKYLVSHKMSEFIESFNKWCNDVTSGNSPYVFPYEIFKLEFNISQDDISLCSAVLWDILINCGLKGLCTDAKLKCAKLSEYAITDIIDNLDDSILDDYIPNSFDSKLLQSCNIHIIS